VVEWIVPDHPTAGRFAADMSEARLRRTLGTGSRWLPSARLDRRWTATSLQTGRGACRTDRVAALEAVAPVHRKMGARRTQVFDQLDSAQLEALRRISERLLEHLVPVKGSTPEDLGLLRVAASGEARRPGSAGIFPGPPPGQFPSQTHPPCTASVHCGS
jgi:hypothetical protein